MKKNLRVAVIIIMAMAYCGSLTSFEGPNSLRNMTGTLFLANCKSISGKLIIQKGSFVEAM